MSAVLEQAVRVAPDPFDRMAALRQWRTWNKGRSSTVYIVYLGIVSAFVCLNIVWMIAAFPYYLI